MRVYRITSRTYAQEPLSGIGASLTGGRWNTKGTRLAYTAGSRSLTMLEMLVHVQRDTVPRDLVMIAIDVPDDAIERLKTLPVGWDGLPYAAPVQAAGDQWVRAGSSLALLVPSAIVADEFNLLVNPRHDRLVDVVIHEAEALVLDARLFP